MFGFACDETPTLMPLPIDLAHRLVENHAKLRRSGELKFVRLLSPALPVMGI